MRILLTTLMVLFSLIFGYAQEEKEYLDTIVYKDLTKEGVANLSIVSSHPLVVTFQRTGSNNTVYLSGNGIDHIKLQNDSIITPPPIKEQSQIGTYTPKKRDSTQRKGDLLIGTNLFAWPAFAPFSEGMINAGAVYYFTPELSIGGHLYRGLFANNALDYYARPQNGGELSFAYTQSTNRRIDFGVRVGVTYFQVKYAQYYSESTSNYTESGNNWDYLYENKYYAFSSSTSSIEPELVSTQIVSSWDPFIAAEANLRMSDRFSLLFNVGYKKMISPYFYSRYNQTESIQYNNYYALNGDLDGTETFTSSGSSGHRQRQSGLVLRLSVYFHLLQGKK